MAPPPRTKRLEHRHLQRLAEVVTYEITTYFSGNGSRFAERLGVSQSHVSQMARGGRGDRGIGLPVLLALADYLRAEGRPQTLGQLIGLEPPPAAPPRQLAPATTDDLRSLREAVDAIRARLDAADAPSRSAPLLLTPSTKGK